ncbi:MAG: hypothetical protein IJM46_04250 [Oscillospiraceae bacterium]|nr:hypothetical protein [Oscillospiraceae bacterium]
MANSNDKIAKLKSRLEAVDEKIKALTAERKSLTEKIKDAENAQLVEMIRNAAPGGEPSDLAQDFAAFMREREAQSEQTSEAAASGVSA